MKFAVSFVLIVSFISGQYGAQQFDRHGHSEVTQINSVHFGWFRGCPFFC